MNQIVIDNKGELLIPHAEAQYYGELNPFESLSENTQIAYKSDVSIFCAWLTGQKLAKDETGKVQHLSIGQMGVILKSHHISAKTIIAFLQHFGFKYKVSTVERKLASVSWALNETEKEVVTGSYEVKKTLKALKKLHALYKSEKIDSLDIKNKGFSPPCKPPEYFLRKAAEPARLGHIKKIINFLDSQELTYNTIRLRALFLVWWFGAFRISEMSNLRIQDVQFVNKGMLINLPTSKSDQSGKGFTKALPAYSDENYCPVLALKKWINVQNREEKGYIFIKIKKNGYFDDKFRKMSSRSFSEMLKAYASLSGIENLKFSGHSPRRGYVTDAWESGARGEDIKAQGWNSDVWERYVERSDLFNNHPSSNLK